MALSLAENDTISTLPGSISPISSLPVPIPSTTSLTATDSIASSQAVTLGTSFSSSSSVQPYPTGSPGTAPSSASPSVTPAVVEKRTTPPQPPTLNGFQARPAGLVNEGNTCYQNSVQQSLASAPTIISLLGPIILNIPPPPNSSSHGINPLLIPSLRDEALEPANAALLPVTLAFQRSIGRQWRLKNESATTPVDSGKAAATGSSSNPPSRKSSMIGLSKSVSMKDKKDKDKEPPAAHMSLRSLLKEMAKKYDQYDGYRQQDAHELLRHMLDSMSMEERDLIKVLQPPPPAKPKKSKRGGRPSLPPPVEEAVGEKEVIKEIPESERMVPFVDLLFGGSLVSAVVCEGCKHVSHTYEGFLDISLSMREGAPKTRKRDKFKAMFGGKDTSKPKPPPSHDAEPIVFLEGVHSDIEPSADDHTPSQSRRTSVDVDRSKVGLSSPEIPAAGLKKRGSLSFGKRPKRLSGGSESEREKESVDGNGNLGVPVAVPRLSSNSSVLSSPAPSVVSKISIKSARSGELEDPTVPPRPTPAQAAYIRRLLNGPNLPDSPKEDPLEALRQATSGGDRPGSSGSGSRPGSRSASPHRLGHHHSKPPIPAGFGTGLMDCLRRFTATEVLEDENAFACKTCWKYQTGRMPERKLAGNRGRSATLVEEDEDDDDGDGDADVEKTSTLEVSSVLSLAGGSSAEDAGAGLGITTAQQKREVPTISIEPETPMVETRGYEGSSETTSLTAADGVMSPASSTGISLLAPSQNGRSQMSSGEDETGSTVSGYLTSDAETSQDEQAPSLPVGRPAPLNRRKSNHYVMRRAFKRYLIAKAAPILVFHFKRFMQTGKSSALGMYASEFSSLKKMDDFISFPEILDIAPFMAPNREDYKVNVGKDGETARYMSHPPGDKGPVLEPLLYKLHAVVVHIGSSTLGGHYVSYVLAEPGRILDPSTYSSHTEPPSMEKLSLHTTKSKSKTKEDKRVWWFCSDQQVRTATTEEVLRSKAYLTFYERWE